MATKAGKGRSSSEDKDAGKVGITVRLAPEVAEKFERLATLDRRSRASLMALVLEDWIRDNFEKEAARLKRD